MCLPSAKLVGIFVWAVAHLSIDGGVVGGAQEPGPVARAASAVVPHGPMDVHAAIVGNQYCVSCHSGGQAILDALSEQAGRDLSGFVSLMEAPAYLARDRHARSKDLVDSPLGREIGRRLGIDDVTSSERCMNCHGSPTPRKSTVSSTSRFDSISCETCHGAAGPLDAPAPYLLAHQQGSDWRTQSPAEKAAQGMLDVRSPAAQAGLCLSCHVGEPTADRWVDHDMYAAGHPLLAEPDLATLYDAMPGHWIKPEQKGGGTRTFLHSSDWYRANYSLPPNEPAADLQVLAVKKSLMGAVVAEANAWEVAGAFAQRRQWPELSFLRCEACHHDLQRPSSRPPEARRGLPMPRYSAPAFIELAAELAKVEPSKRPRTRAWRKRFLESPYGGIIGAAETLQEVAARRALATQLAAVTIHPQQVDGFARRLLAPQRSAQDDWEPLRRKVWFWAQCQKALQDSAQSIEPMRHPAWSDLDKRLLLTLPRGHGPLGDAWIGDQLSRGAALDRPAVQKSLAALLSEGDSGPPPPSPP